MPKIRLKFAIRDIEGTLYEVNLSRSHQEETSSTKHPNASKRRPAASHQEASESQKAHRQHFKQAVAYAKAALADPQVRARYEQMAQQQGKGPRGAAVADYLKGNDLLAKK